MVLNSPTHALGGQADGVRDLMINVVRTLHDRFAEAHRVSESKYAMGFGSQWRDLLDEAHNALTECGFESYKLPPGGHKVGIVNGCLIYVWRVPEDPNAIANFASSPTRQNGFAAPIPPAGLWDPSLDENVDPIETSSDVREKESTATLMTAVGDPMPMVLVMVHSVPRQLQSIEWAVADLDTEGKVQLRGRDTIWEPEPVAGDVTSEVESFDQGEPVTPDLEPRTQEWPGTDA